MTSKPILRSVPFAQALCIGFLLISFVGCSRTTLRPVNPVKAREVLQSTMEAWKQGKTPEQLAEASPPVIAQDFDWMQGKKLTAYTINPKDAPTGSNLTCQVTLQLEDKEGNPEEKSVYYVVGTSPGLSVFRDAR